MQVQQTKPAVSNWIEELSKESDVYLVNMGQSETLIGLLILVDEPQIEAALKVHIGYLLSQAAWGKGYASELLAGLLKETRKNAPMTLIGGVARGNEASAHILRKLGFLSEPNLSDDDTEVFTATVAETD